MKRYFVDAQRSVPFDTLEEAKQFAQQNFPAVILERQDDCGEGPLWKEILRFDRMWDEAQGKPVIGFF